MNFQKSILVRGGIILAVAAGVAVIGLMGLFTYLGTFDRGIDSPDGFTITQDKGDAFSIAIPNTLEFDQANNLIFPQGSNPQEASGAETYANPLMFFQSVPATLSITESCEVIRYELEETLFISQSTVATRTKDKTTEFSSLDTYLMGGNRVCEYEYNGQSTNNTLFLIVSNSEPGRAIFASLSGNDTSVETYTQLESVLRTFTFLEIPETTSQAV